MKSEKIQSCCRGRCGMVLVLTMIVLVVLASLTAYMSVRVTQARRRQQFLIDYQQARYACDSALKYMLTIMPEKSFGVQPREGLPDFSDLYWMDEQMYEQYIRYWLSTATPEQIEKVRKEQEFVESEVEELPENISLADVIKKLVDRMTESEDEQTKLEEEGLYLEEIGMWVDPNEIEIPGPYMEEWPYVMEPIELEMGPAKVSITVEDENAKMPMAWAAITTDLAEAAVQTFFEWMQMDEEQIDDIREECDQVREIKVFTVENKPISQLSRAAPAAAKPSPAPAPSSANSSRFRTSRTTASRTQTASQPAQQQDELSRNIQKSADFGKLFYSTLLNKEKLGRSISETGRREQSPLKYLSLWGAQQVNVNTAPRHVLEAAFMFGGEEKNIAERIIEQRRIKPFRSIDELREPLFEYTEELKKAEPYITAQSYFFQIRVSARSGNARCTAAAAVFKDKKDVRPLAVIYER